MLKIWIRYGVVCCLLIFLIAFQAAPMEEEELPFLFNELKDEDHYDPLFFELLTTKTQRRVIVIGSIHTVHPRILFSQPVYNLLLDLSTHAILFTEHASINQHLMPQAVNLHRENAHILWDPNTFWQPEEKNTNKDVWQYIAKQDYKFIEDVPITSIQRMRRPLGIMLFYSFASDTYRQKFSGFETCLRSWKTKGRWKGEISYLEELDPFLHTFTQSAEPELKSFFGTALKHYHKVIYLNKDKEKVELLIKQELQNSLKTYNYEDYVNSHEQSEPTKVRNEAWSVRIIEYLEFYSQDNTPIVIVCGAAHLKGGTKENSRSLLDFLLKSKHFSSIYRINKGGIQIKVDL